MVVGFCNLVNSPKQEYQIGLTDSKSGLTDVDNSGPTGNATGLTGIAQQKLVRLCKNLRK